MKMVNLNQRLADEDEDSSKEKEKDDISTKLLQTRTIIISNQVDGKLADTVTKQLLLLEKEDAEAEIKVFINSPGGEVSSGYAIFDLIRFVTCPVSTLVMGYAASMGSVLSLSADEGKRYAFPNSRIMIHQPLLGGVRGVATDLEIHSKEILKTKRLIADLYAEKTGKPVEQILKDMDRDRWFSASDALEYGLIDKIITTRKELDEG